MKPTIKELENIRDDADALAWRLFKLAVICCVLAGIAFGIGAFFACCFIALIGCLAGFYLSEFGTANEKIEELRQEVKPSASTNDDGEWTYDFDPIVGAFRKHYGNR